MKFCFLTFSKVQAIEPLKNNSLENILENDEINYKILEQIASKTNLIIDFGGGLKSNEDIKIVFDSGASQVTGGSIAVKQPSIFMEWIEKFGSEKIILGADVKNQNIAIDGWLKVSNKNIFDFIDNFQKKGRTLLFNWFIRNYLTI